MSESEVMVIIGAGLGGISAAAALREDGFKGRVVLVNNEAELPYDRPPLSKSILQGEQSIVDVYLKSEVWYAEHNIELLNNVAVSAINPANNTVSLSDGSELGYTKLLIATGADVRKIPSLEHANIPHFYLRTDQDTLGLKEYMKAGQRMVLVGAGVIGLEVAASAVQCGCDVTVLELADRVMMRSMPEVMSAWLQKQHEAKGVKFHMADSISEFVESNNETKIVLGSGTELSADVMLICAGVIPAMQLAEAAGIECGNGIVVNEFAQTSSVDIYAIGDVAFYPDAWQGESMRSENWMHAQRHAECAARNMNGANLEKQSEAYAELQTVWTDQYDIKVQVAGVLVGEQEIIRGDMDSGKFMIFYVNGDVVAGVLGVNSAKFMRIGQNMIKKKASVDLVMLADPESNLKKLI